MANNKQLTRIVAPNINEVNYADKMQSVFDNINENFAKIASLPFIQGVQGDSYQLIEKDIWYKDGGDWKITEDGAILLNSIFGYNDPTYSGGKYIQKRDTFTEIRNLIGLTLNKVSPIDFFKKDGIIVNNTLYFYAVINDEGIEEQKQLGQYYYFIDARLKTLGNSYNNGVITSFEDYTGFYQYIPAENGNDPYYRKIDILPSIYYDATKNDICWKFNGNETGISAIGVNGKDGHDTNLQIVKVDIGGYNPSNTLASDVIGVFKFNETNDADEWDHPSTTNIYEGYAMIVIKTSAKTYISYGEIKNMNNVWRASWNNDTILDTDNIDILVNQYFYGMGKNTNPYPRFLAIPSKWDRTSVTTPVDEHAHVIRTQMQGIDYPETDENLIFKYAKNVWKNNLQQNEEHSTINNIKKDILLDNYNLRLQRLASDDIPAPGISSTYIEHGKLTLHNTNSSDDTLIVDGGNTLLKGNLTVDRDTLLKSKANIKGATTIDGATTINNSLSVTGTASADLVVVNSHIVFKNNVTSGNSVHQIKINTNSGSNRHLDVITDGLYLFKTEFQGEDTGKVELNVDGDINTYGGGNLSVNGDSSVKGDSSVNGNLNLLGKGYISPVWTEWDPSNFYGKSNVKTYKNYSKDHEVTLTLWWIKSKYPIPVINYIELDDAPDHAIIFPSCYPAYGTATLFFRDDKYEHFNLIKDVDSWGNPVRVHAGDMGYKEGAIFYIFFKKDTFDWNGSTFRKIHRVISAPGIGYY